MGKTLVAEGGTTLQGIGSRGGAEKMLAGGLRNPGTVFHDIKEILALFRDTCRMVSG